MARIATTTTSVRRRYRLWFLIDGLVTGVNALAYLLLSQFLPGLFGSTVALYLTVGIILAVVTIGLLIVAWSPRRLGVLAGILVVVNILWAVASFLTAAINPFGLNGLGLAWTIVQGAVVLAFGLLQARALRASAS